MNKEKSSSSPSSPLSAYADVGQWLGDRPLAQLALDAVLAQESAGTLPKAKTSAYYQPRVMLTLLGYCYARGWYGSRQIEQAILKHPMARYLCAHRYPDWNVLRRFRRDHREVLAACLNHIFTQAWAIKLDRAEVDFLGYNWFETEFTKEIEQEVQSRIDLASYIDMMEVDM